MKSQRPAALGAVRKLGLDKGAGLGLVGVGVFFLVSGLFTYGNVRMLRDDGDTVVHSHAVIMALDTVLSDIQDAETGQRGFLLVGEERYLAPYESALGRIDPDLDQLGELVAASATQRGRMDAVRRHVGAKITELRQTVELRRSQGLEGALAAVRTDRGKSEMDTIRTEIAAMRREETALRIQRVTEMQSAYVYTWMSGIVSGVLGLMLTGVVAFIIRRNTATRRRQQWLQSGLVALASELLGEQSVEQLGEHVLGFFADFLGAKAGVVFGMQTNGYARLATYGVPADARIVAHFTRNDGLLGRVVATGRRLALDEVPDDYLMFGSALGRRVPRHLVIFPLQTDGIVQGVVELGFATARDAETLRFLDEASAPVAIALRAARYRAELANLLGHTQQQAEELQVQGEELRVSNEELEEQGRALRESAARLEQQQIELEQINTQLEEQAQQLETQRDDLARSKESVEHKAAELERASRYKSDFLANMSHELRTPLNSSLILSRLLAENPDDNLTEEQVRYARTIEASGNDLLVLINDILDLSKIEAGHVDIRPEVLPLDRLAATLRPLFQPVAEQKGLGFEIVVAEGCPATIEIDRLRLEQILKNLLANALKFTERGQVSVQIRPAGDTGIAFAVIDTGIGISPEQQRAIFEAFHQADGTISRRYGGTGLGLSISRELARLLGGTITLESAPGTGSTFTVILPRDYVPVGGAAAEPAASREPAAAVSNASLTPPLPAACTVLPRPIEDDRDRLSGARRVVLVVEDDAVFATILRDRARQMGFDCLVAGTAEEALRLAKQHAADAIVLDVGLPDQSGLSVLDRLKRDVRTRHIPVQVVSGADHAQTALSLGAVGYALKPVRPDELGVVFGSLEKRLSQGVRRVLVVEDDPVQREAVGKLLSADDVQTVGVGTAAECLERLGAETFDCMVLDLSLPDASGFSLLETLSGSGTHAFPPVIVYTGRDLSVEEEQRLRRYSKSIIIKGAKSPERLLDEVALFLHQVVAELPPERQSMIRKARNRDSILEGRRILIVEDDVRNVYSLTNILEPRGAIVEIARNGAEALEALQRTTDAPDKAIDLVLMDVMMPVMDGLTAMREIRKEPQWRKLPVIALTAKAMPDDQERCIAAGASDYMAKPLDVDKLLSLVRVWMPR